MRYAIITDGRTKLSTVQRYLPSNFDACLTDGGILIQGVDRFGWTWEDYVRPRLASGLIWAKEITSDDVALLTVVE